jgi:hypothetical protein
MGKIKDIKGIKFHHLTVLQLSYIDKKSRRTYWECICDCGTKKIVSRDCLLRGNTKSCGCIPHPLYTHKEAGKTKEYRAWVAIKNRCTNPNSSKYNSYGLRGIKVCGRWVNSYENFLNDMGRAPSKEHSIDRIDNNKDYSSLNCRWATATEQANNTRKNRLIMYRGQTKTLAEWCRHLNLNYKTITMRIVRGFTSKEAFEFNKLSTN